MNTMPTALEFPNGQMASLPPRPPGNRESQSSDSLLLMPSDVQPDHVFTLVEVMEKCGGKVSVHSLAYGLKVDLRVLSALLEAARILSLVEIERGDVRLTGAALDLAGTQEARARALKDTISKVEPFRTALELTMGGKTVTTAEVAKALAPLNLEWDPQPETNESRINSLLIDWTISSNILRYDGKSGGFEKA